MASLLLLSRIFLRVCAVVVCKKAARHPLLEGSDCLGDGRNVSVELLLLRRKRRRLLLANGSRGSDGGLGLRAVRLGVLQLGFSLRKRLLGGLEVGAQGRALHLR